MSDSLDQKLKTLMQKVDRILALLEERGSQQSSAAAPRRKTSKPKALPLSEEETTRHRERFEKLFASWEAGEELQVEKELDAMDAEEIRRFADANNLNVTTKTPKQKVLNLIAGRFRERRQLMRSHFNRRPETE